jgi:hypothetical protein
MYVFDRENDYEKDEESFTIRYPSNLGQTKIPGRLFPSSARVRLLPVPGIPGFVIRLFEATVINDRAQKYITGFKKFD